jgi:hypothetical protein
MEDKDLLNPDPVNHELLNGSGVTKIKIRRPRNQFIIYRQWKSAKIHELDPTIPAGTICKSVSTS